MLFTRVLTATVLLIVLIGFAGWAPAIAFDVLLLVILAVACTEWMRLLGLGTGASAVVGLGFIGLGLFGLFSVPSVMATAHGIGQGVLPLYVMATLVWCVAVPVAIVRFTAIGAQRFAGRAVAFALCFAAWCALLHADGLGKAFLLSVLLLVWVADTAAYFAGRAFGRHKLAPKVSPGKTREGVAGALAGTLLLAIVLAPMPWTSQANPAGNLFSFLVLHLGWAVTLMVVVMITLISVMGDLYESLLKRLANVKDSGSLLPGHGGVLDRVDALIAVFPVTMGIVSLIQSGVF